MNLLSKVILLLLALIILIISCVYTHVKELENKNPIFDIPNKLENFVKSELFIENENTDNLEKNIKRTNKPLANILEENKSTEKFDILKNVKQDDKIESSLKSNISKKENIDIKIMPIKIENKISNIDTIDKLNKKDRKEILDKKYIKVLLETKVLKEEKKDLVSDIVKDESLSKNKNVLIQKEINEEIKKQRIIFKIKSFQLSAKSYELIKKIALILKKNKDIRIEVAGHTDAKGKEEVNQYYSFERAKVVKKELVKYGIDKSRIIAKGYGESKPLVKNDPQGYSKINRRVEFNIIEE